MKLAFFKIAEMLLLLSLLDKLHASFLKAKAHPDPMTLNVTYEYPVSDLTDRRRHANETFNYQSRIKELEAKIERDSQLLKMILNTQNVQIQKMTEVFYLNEALLFHNILEKAEDDKAKAQNERILGKMKDNESISNLAKVVRLDHPDTIRQFLDGVCEAGLISDSYKRMNNKEIFHNFKHILEKAIVNSSSKLG